MILILSLASKLLAKKLSISYYAENFIESERIGSGSYSIVHKCIHKLDGWIYAVKKLKNRIRTNSEKNSQLKEVYALAALGGHNHIVRYYTAWVEDDRLYIQMEYCEGGSLSDQMKKSQTPFDEKNLCTILRHVASGLHHMHSKKLVHLDIKPANIYVTPDGDYKIGDFGLIVMNDTTLDDVVEGDNKYLPKELLRADYSNLPRADIFSLGCTIYELVLFLSWMCHSFFQFQ